MDAKACEGVTTLMLSYGDINTEKGEATHVLMLNLYLQGVYSQVEILVTRDD